ncbi:hypothetical protein [Amycolatopsis sp. cg9]|uniref:DUF7715 family protein n=1 Tax=Amycolatopsis sp. cg9 TaxID=3238801 RepID=UPI0035235FBE
MPTLAVLVATARTQKQRGNDFLACSPDELVDITSSCDRDRGRPDGGCGCCRSFTGLDSRKATTTAEVVERQMTFADYVAAHQASLIRAGLPDTDEVRGWAEEAARDMARIAAAFPVGTVVERRGDQILERVQVAARSAR